MSALGAVPYNDHHRPTDYLFRVSMKCLIKDSDGKVLVVKEMGRSWWDLPGGGIDHGETIQEAIGRELHEEVGLTSEFTYHVLTIEDPRYLEEHNFWQLRIVVSVQPDTMTISVGEDGDEVAFLDPKTLASSDHSVEQLVCRYAQLD